MITSRSRSSLAAAIVGALAFAACGGSDEVSSDGDVCADLERVVEIAAAGDAATTDAEVADALRDLAAALEDVAASAPDELRADAEKFAEATAVLTGIQEGQEELTAEQEAVISDVDIERASNAVRDFAEQECGLEF